MYIIAGHHRNKGIRGDDSNTLHGYWELGWECSGSNVLIKDMLFRGKISKQDIIVTRAGREFFYSSLFDEVISYEEFLSRNIPESQILDLTKEIMEKTMMPENRSLFHNVDKDTVCNFDLDNNIREKYNIQGSFFVYCLRMRDHCSHRNMYVDVAIEVIRRLQTQYNLRGFVVGQGAEKFCEQNNTEYLDLRDFASLMRLRECSFCIAPLSGIAHVSNYCGHDRMHNFIFDQGGEKMRAGQDNHPLYLGELTNYRQTKNIFTMGHESVDKIFELYNTYIGHPI